MGNVTLATTLLDENYHQLTSILAMIIYDCVPNQNSLVLVVLSALQHAKRLIAWYI